MAPWQRSIDGALEATSARPHTPRPVILPAEVKEVLGWFPYRDTNDFRTWRAAQMITQSAVFLVAVMGSYSKVPQICQFESLETDTMWNDISPEYLNGVHGDLKRVAGQLGDSGADSSELASALLCTAKLLEMMYPVGDHRPQGGDMLDIVARFAVVYTMYLRLLGVEFSQMAVDPLVRGLRRIMLPILPAGTRKPALYREGGLLLLRMNDCGGGPQRRVGAGVHADRPHLRGVTALKLFS